MGDLRLAAVCTAPRRLSAALLLLLVLLAGGAAVAEAKKGKKGKAASLDKEIKEQRVLCDKRVRDDAGPCLQDAITLENCVLRCISRHCYDEVYLDDPLEEGEVDTQRGRTFRTCARNELRADRKARRDATRNGEDAVDDVDTSK